VTVLVEGYILVGLWAALHRHGLKPIAPGLLWARLNVDRRRAALD
jgi:hypothetical protein